MSSIISNSSRVVPGLIEPPGGRVILEQVTPPDGQAILPGAQPALQPGGSSDSFGDLLSNAINSVNDSQIRSARAQDALLHGEPVELHDVMIKAEEAGIALDLMLEIRNKLLNAYNDIMRMPM